MRNSWKYDWEKSKTEEKRRKNGEKSRVKVKKGMPKKPESVISQTNFHSKWNLL